jgi:hypothetical protein
VMRAAAVVSFMSRGVRTNDPLYRVTDRFVLFADDCGGIGRMTITLIAFGVFAWAVLVLLAFAICAVGGRYDDALDEFGKKGTGGKRNETPRSSAAVNPRRPRVRSNAPRP